MPINRVNIRPDVLFTMIVVSKGWIPRSVYDTPPGGQLISQTSVANFAEAICDLVRSNTISIEKGLRQWAIIQMAEGEA